MTLEQRASEVIRKTPGSASAIVRRISGLTRSEQDTGVQVVTVALLLGHAYDGVRGVGQDVDAWIDAQVLAGKLVCAAADISSRLPPHTGTSDSYHNLAQQVLDRAGDKLRRYGIDQRRKNLGVADVLSPNSVRSWATRYGIEEVLPAQVR